MALANVDSLPGMPAVAQKLLTLPLDTDEGEAQLLTLIEQDPQISAKLIGLANSPAMGVSRKVNNISDAAMLLGLAQVKTVSLGIAAMASFPKLRGSQNFAPHDLWMHSLAIAIAMHTLSHYMPRELRPKQDQIYLAGLLHDIGYMVIHHVDSESSNELHHQLRLQPKRHVLEIELQTIGISHCLVGANLARKWNLPEEIVNVLEHHHLRSKNTTYDPLIGLLNLAEKLLPNFGINEYCGTEIDEQEWLELGIAPESAAELFDIINEIATQVAQMADIF